jgi:hypothetical protein
MALDTQEWLVWLGVKEPQTNLSEIKSDIERLKDSVGTWSDFQNLVSNSADYSEFEQNLLNEGFPSDKVGAFIDKIQDQYSSYTAFQDDVVNVLTSYIEFQSRFGNQHGLTGSRRTADGEPVAGLRVHDESGVSYSGINVPAGTTEIYGRRIEFSQQDAGVNYADLTYSNQSTDDSDNVVTIYQDITISADASNPNSFGMNATIPLKADGSVIAQETIRLEANVTRSVSFTLSRSNYVCEDLAIGTLSPITVCWVPSGLN